MKKFILIFAFILISLITFQKEVFAHSRGVPVFKINGTLTKVYPIESSSIEPFLGDSSDVASENYLVNQNLEFEFEASRSAQAMETLRGDEGLLEKVTYTWDFGDGTTKHTNTPKNNHTYTKMGSYITQIEADFSQTGMQDFGKQLVQSTLIHILPNKDYKLPEPVININGQAVSSSNLVFGNFPPSEGAGGLFARIGSKKTLEFDFNKRLSFDASDSKASSSRIIQYQWDLGQGDVAKNKSTSIKYKLPQAFTTAVLRVKDENGFIAEAAVDLRNSGKNEPTGFSFEEVITPTTLLISTQVIIFAVGVTLYLRRKRKKI